MPLDAEQRARVVALRSQGKSYERIQVETGWGIRLITDAIVEAEHVEAGMAVAVSTNPRIVVKREELGELWLDLMKSAVRTLRAMVDDPGLTLKNLQTIAIVAGISADKVQDFMWGRRGAEININENRSMFSGMSNEELMAEMAAVKAGLANSEALPGEFKELPGG